MVTRARAVVLAVIGLVFLAVSSRPADAVLTYSLEGVSGWPNQAHYDAAEAAISAVVDRYNAYAPNGFNNYNVYVYYDSGIPTAQASWGGSIGFGGTYPNERVTQHEMAHYVGLPDYNTWSGTGSGIMSGGVWQGALADQLVQQFEGDGAELHGDSIHFWPYGLNYDSEWSELAGQRQVAMVYAMRGDMGIGPTAHPSSATTVSLTASDSVGTSGFNYMDRWSDGYFAHAGADYFTGDYLLRTPASGSSFTFAGDSVTIDNTNGSSGGLIYKGTGTSGVVTIDDLRLDGGWIQHMNGSGDLFQLDGNLSVLSASSISAKQGNINILADLQGTEPLTIETSGGRYFVRLLSDNNSFTGDLINKWRLELSEGASYMFEIGSSGTNNAISGPSAVSTVINGSFDLDLSGASSNPTDSWALVTAANTTYGNDFNIPGFSNNLGVWSNGTYTFNQSTGLLSLVTQWAVNGGGLWSSAGNWTGGVPPTGGDATLGAVPTTAAAVDLDVPATLNRLTFDNANKYTLSGANTLTLTGGAELLVLSGSHEIAVPVAGSSGLSKSGTGTATLSAANTYSGDTNIKAGTLKLAGGGSIAGSANIAVQTGATLDVSGLAGGLTLVSGQTLSNESSTTVVGNVVAATGSAVTGTGSFIGGLTLQAGASLRVGAEGLPAGSAPALIDDFDSYDNSSNQNIGAHSNGDVTGGVWDGVFDGTNNGQVVDNATDPADNELVAFGIPSQGAGGWRGGVTDLSSNFGSDFSLADGDTATYFFQVMNEGNGSTDTMIGLTENLTSLDINNSWQDFAVMPYVGGGSLKVYGSNIGDQTVTAMSNGQWYNVWLVVDNDAKTFDMYYSTGTDEGTLAYSNVSFGRLTAPGDLTAFGIAAHEDGRVRIDNLFVTSGENTLNPLGVGGGIVYSPEVLTVMGDLLLEEGATVTLDIGTSGVGDLVDISGSLTAGGTLEVVLAASAPSLQLGDAFDLFDFASASGSFDGYILPGLGSGLYWDVSRLTAEGTLTVVDTLPGDFDGDGDTDVADLLYWQRTDGTAGSLDAWKLGFGGSALTGGASIVPEPSAFLLVSAAAFGFIGRWRRD